ncbi:uncharacterized protein LOC105740493 [Nomascus leucogenys]|uniref:uncharacterized protein LOC105740493 n=1 Tax=Nomascus leucogenys TaxID=61853 RepID=UPI00062A7E60|nr:uncharacterized protein LOC105740493 [Nomascus leucogenys]
MVRAGLYLPEIFLPDGKDVRQASRPPLAAPERARCKGGQQTVESPGAELDTASEGRNEVAAVPGPGHARSLPSEPSAVSAKPAWTLSGPSASPRRPAERRCSESPRDCCAGPAAASRTQHPTALWASC